jgi:hypothetical protein
MKTNKKVEKSLKKRVNKSKEEIVSDFAKVEKIAHIKEVVRKVFPLLENMKTIYDGQTTVNALAGFIDAHVEKKVGGIKLSEINVDLSHEEDSEIKTAILEIIAMFPDESAQELSETLERLGRTLSQFAADKFLKEPMSTIKISDILS